MAKSAVLMATCASRNIIERPGVEFIGGTPSRMNIAIGNGKKAFNFRTARI